MLTITVIFVHLSTYIFQYNIIFIFVYSFDNNKTKFLGSLTKKMELNIKIVYACDTIYIIFRLNPK